MLKQLGTFFLPPVFPEDEDKTRKARYAHIIALAFLAIAVGFELFVRLFAGYADMTLFDVVLFGLALICVLGLFLLPLYLVLAAGTGVAGI
jgi:hypothetical protein